MPEDPTGGFNELAIPMLYRIADAKLVDEIDQETMVGRIIGMAEDLAGLLSALPPEIENLDLLEFWACQAKGPIAGTIAEAIGEIAQDLRKD